MNCDRKTIESFGSEWKKHHQGNIAFEELKNQFNKYFENFPWGKLSKSATGFDMGCGSGRWAQFVAPKVFLLNCVEPSEAIDIAKKKLSNFENIKFYKKLVDESGIQESSQDFGYCLGVLHHIPNTQQALNSCVKLLKPEAPFLLYIYYALENKPWYYQLIWKLTNCVRWVISSLSNKYKNYLTDIIALLVYLPLSRVANVLEYMNLNINNIPLSAYRKASWATLRTDARDRFGTPLEQRFTKNEIHEMMKKSGLKNIEFSEGEPYWRAIAYKA